MLMKGSRKQNSLEMSVQWVNANEKQMNLDICSNFTLLNNVNAKILNHLKLLSFVEQNELFISQWIRQSCDRNALRVGIDHFDCGVLNWAALVHHSWRSGWENGVHWMLKKTYWHEIYDFEVLKDSTDLASTCSNREGLGARLAITPL